MIARMAKLGRKVTPCVLFPRIFSRSRVRLVMRVLGRVLVSGFTCGATDALGALVGYLFLHRLIRMPSFD